MVQLFLLPCALGVLGRQQPEAGVAAVDENVELAVVVLHGRSPHATGVGILAVLQVVTVAVGQLCQRLCTILPVDHILRLQDGGTGEEAHGGRDHIVGVVHADDVGVGEVGTDHGVHELTVAQVADGSLVDIVGHRVVHLSILGIPHPASAATSLSITVEGRHGVLGVLHHLVEVYVVVRVRQRHGDIPKLLKQILEAGTPLRC